MKRERSARILATLGPASSTRERIRALAEAGADVFRLNFSHGSHEDHAERYRLIRAVEAEIGRPIGVLMDLQGPKLRVGRFAEGKVALVPGARFRLDLDPTAGDAKRANLPHPEIFAALEAGTELLLDDGKLRLRVDACGADFADTTVLVGGTLSDRKGVNVPGVVLPISPLTAKDRADLDFGLALGVDWVALSFVQRPEDLREARELIGDRAWIMAKLEKPAAIDALDAIIALADGVMVALSSPVPTRAEASDVATAIYDGADAVMLSAESASGQYPVEAVAIMHGIVCEVERDPAWRAGLEASHTAAAANTPDAICCALRRVAGLLEPAATVAYTSSGFSALRASRERPVAPILALTPQPATARRLALVWGVHAVPFEEVHDVAEMVEHAARAASTLGFGSAGDAVVVIAGLPFGQRGSTNLLHVARIPG